MTTNWQGQSLEDELKQAIEKAIPESSADVSSQGGHFHITVVSPAFEGKRLLEKQRMVYSVITPWMSGVNAPVHAVDTLKTLTPTS